MSRAFERLGPWSPQGVPELGWLGQWLAQDLSSYGSAEYFPSVRKETFFLVNSRKFLAFSQEHSNFFLSNSRTLEDFPAELLQVFLVLSEVRERFQREVEGSKEFCLEVWVVDGDLYSFFKKEKLEICTNRDEDVVICRHPHQKYQYPYKILLKGPKQSSTTRGLGGGRHEAWRQPPAILAPVGSPWRLVRSASCPILTPS